MTARRAASTWARSTIARKRFLGPSVYFDGERCIKCTRCVRFCQEITKTDELTVINRGDHSTIALFDNTVLDNPLSANVVDICPVGALTDRDFRFKVRVWYLDKTPSICPGCERRVQHQCGGVSEPHRAL